jgi:hypothetical protein
MGPFRSTIARGERCMALRCFLSGVARVHVSAANRLTGHYSIWLACICICFGVRVDIAMSVMQARSQAHDRLRDSFIPVTACNGLLNQKMLHLHAVQID